ncbi:MAG: hypothetical protein ACK4NR_04945 [Micavibrio sp.]
MLLSTPSFAGTCQVEAKPQINFSHSKSEPRFDYSLTRAQLENFKGNAEIPLAAVYDLTINAMHTGKMSMNHKMKYVVEQQPDGQLCTRIDSIDVSFEVDPVIYMAQELRTEACEYKEYLLHELKHVDEDMRLMADYQDVVMRNMDFALSMASDYSVGPIPPSLLKEAQEELSYNITGVLQATFDSMMRERPFRQREIDSTGEYMRLTLACVGKN